MADPSALVQSALSSRIAVAAAKKANDATKDQGEAMVSLLEGAVQFARDAAQGAVSAAPSLAETGQNLDTTA